MPNWVENNVRIEGPEADLREYVSRSLAGYVIKEGDRDLARRRGLSYMEPQVVAEGVFSFGGVTGVDDDYAHNWYERAAERWGTKWEACDVTGFPEADDDLSAGVIEFSFNTAWSPPSPYWQRVSQEFPSLRIATTWIDEGLNFVGYTAAAEGALHDTDLNPFNPPVPPYPNLKDDATEEEEEQWFVEDYPDWETAVRNFLRESATLTVKFF